ncbi:hypothetical protein [Amycolatopsis sp. NPDC004169]
MSAPAPARWTDTSGQLHRKNGALDIAGPPVDGTGELAAAVSDHLS